ncbi:MAG: hypothetical protein AMXMBFR61_21810 [Fimbriimonadales bacterium]
MTVGEILGHFPVFGQCSDGTMVGIREGAARATFGKGEHVFLESDRLDRFALIGCGSLRVYRTGSGDKELTLYRVSAGQFCIVNALAVLTGRPAVASAVSEEPTEMVLLRPDHVQLLLADCRPFRDFLFGAAFETLVGVLQLVQEVALETVTTRLAGYLLRRATAGPGDFFVHATHEEIAADLGTAREVVSRTLKNFEHSGLVSLSRNHIRLTDVERLHEVAEGTAGREN